LHDPAAAGRLWTEVQRAFAKPGLVTSKNGLHVATGIARPTLDNWLVKGIQPTPEGMAKMAEALGVDPAMLWLRWLDLPPPRDELGRIAEEIAALRQVLARPIEAEMHRVIPEDVGQDPRDIRIRRAHAAPLHRRHDDPQ
jgi:lambda repressor-like predicted transcriptional regulator